MLRTTLAPLRTTVGPALPITALLVDRSEESSVVDVTIQHRELLHEIATDPLYEYLVPSEVYFGGQLSPSTPVNGVATFPLPVDLPFANFDTPFVSLFGIGNVRVEEDISRKLWVEIEIEVDPKFQGAIGGICFGGFPYLPSYVNEVGEASSNWGLPREMRLSWWSDQTEGFVDAEDAVTNQEPTSHGGVHILATGPVRAHRLRLRLSDFPRMLVSVRPLVTNDAAVTEAWGFVLPYLYVFAYEEGTRYAPRVPAGLLAATADVPEYRYSYFAPILLEDDEGRAPYTGMSPDLVIRAAGGVYIPLSAGSLFGQRRTYEAGGDVVEEYFTSGRIRPGRRIRITFEQAEEEPRCIAALRLIYPPGMFQKGVPVPDSRRFDIDIYEVDPAEGVSPVDRQRPLPEDRFALRLYTAKGVLPDEGGVICRFVRPSSGRRFAIVFTCPPNGAPRRLALQEIALVQSAHVDVNQRPSRSQTLRALHFRVFGPDLGADYARIGDGGFAFSIDHVVAGERREVLFEARTLLDMLQIPGARLTANHRFEETIHEEVEEQASTHPGGTDTHRTRTRSTGWASSESGEHADGTAVTWTGDAASAPLAANAFVTFSSSETRTQAQQLPPAAAAIDASIREGISTLAANLGVPLPALVSTLNDLTQGSIQGLSWESDIWAPVLEPANASITGLTIYSLPPVLGSLIAAIDSVVALLDDARQGQVDMDAMQTFRDAIIGTLASITPLAWVNGVGVSVNASGGASSSAGIGVSGSMSGNYGGALSINTQLPTVTQNITVGVTGNVTKQAQAVGYSYTQNLNERFDGATISTDFDGGHIARRTVRDIDIDARETRRNVGAEVYWLDKRMDILSATIPIDVTLPGTASQLYRTTDEAIRVRFSNGIAPGIRVDVRIDVVEDLVPDDR